MALLSLTLELDGLDPEWVEAACLEAGAVSLSFTDQRDDPILEPAPGEFRLWPATRLQALFDAATADRGALAATLAGALGVEPARLHFAAVEERAWERAWLEDFHPMRFGERLWICPSHAHVSEPGAVVVRLDPGLAFGTGTHPSTRLCLEWLDAHPIAGARAIDFGCGSGVLAVAAAKLGAAQVDAHDIDPQALLATGENAAANGVGPRVAVHAAAETLPSDADLLLANILSSPLVELAPRLAGRLAPGGSLVLAGLLDEQAEEVIAAYAPWLRLEAWRRLEGWTCLAGQRAGDGRPTPASGSECRGSSVANRRP
ncbi:MAG: 50S ribosomal protein L11 methyltransferase [Steroidobacteraceae bacterium]|jgi:ribosomal protein L11 methyltransferase|nr:50S ribosomal protein L11 methyltransferase [Steroidobacteraceae bacterium]